MYMIMCVCVCVCVCIVGETQRLQGEKMCGRPSGFKNVGAILESLDSLLEVSDFPVLQSDA
jgi:hypothetical protein